MFVLSADLICMGSLYTNIIVKYKSYKQWSFKESVRVLTNLILKKKKKTTEMYLLKSITRRNDEK